MAIALRPTAGAQSPTLRESVHLEIRNSIRVPYSHESTTDTWDILSLTEAAATSRGNILTIYGNTSLPAASAENDHWEREHLWPQSYGTGDSSSCGYPYTDLHHLYPTEPLLNQSRSNLPFDDCTAPDCTLKGAGNRMRGGPDGVWEVWPERRGDVARAILYMDVRYEGGFHPTTGCEEPDLIVTDTRSIIVPVPPPAPVGHMGMLSTLIRWHLADPVDMREACRNDIVEVHQRNRNPFVDKPELVCQLWEGCPLPHPSTTIKCAPSGSGLSKLSLPFALRGSILRHSTATPIAAETSTPSVTSTPAPESEVRIASLECSGRNEFIRIENNRSEEVDLEGWSIKSVEGSQTFVFAGYILEPGTSVSVHSGPDAPESGAGVLRWSTGYIWNNEGDAAELRNAAADVIDRRDCRL